MNFWKSTQNCLKKLTKISQMKIFEKLHLATLKAFEIQDNRQQIWYEKDTLLSEIDLRE